MNTPDCDITENLKIIQEIFTEAIRIDVTSESTAWLDYHNASGKLQVNLAYKGNAAFYDGLTRSWNVSVRNKDLLITVLKELRSLQPSVEDPVNEDDFLG